MTLNEHNHSTQHIASTQKYIYAAHNSEHLTALKTPHKLELVTLSLILPDAYKVVLGLGVCMHAYIISIFPKALYLYKLHVLHPFPITLSVTLSPEVAV